MLITSVNLQEFWEMGTYIIDTRNMVAFFTALGVDWFVDFEEELY